MHTDWSSLSLWFFNCDDLGSHFNKTHPNSLAQQIRIWWQANQLINSNTMQRFPEPSKWSSQFGSLGYTIMGRLPDLTVFQKTINWQPFTRRVNPQTFIAKEAGCSQSAVSKHVNRKLSGRKKCGRKRCTTQPREPQPYEDCQVKIDSRIWVNFTRNGLRLGSRHQRATTHRRVRNLATVFLC